MIPYMQIQNLFFTYGKETKHPCEALKDISMEINRGEFIGIIGASGSGKSTLLRQLNGLLKPDRGQILLEGNPTRNGDKINNDLRRHVGLVFQYPEHQLFKNTVLQDVEFGPLNMGKTKEEAREASINALEKVGIKEDVFDQSPFDLSGGQMRRVALAGILAMEPELLILDEPTAGLDPHSKTTLLGMLKQMQREGIGIVLVSHCMDDVAQYCNRVYVLEEGRICLSGTTKEVLNQTEAIQNIHMKVPQVTEIMEGIKTFIPETMVTCDYEEAKKIILAHFQNEKGAEQ